MNYGAARSRRRVGLSKHERETQQMWNVCGQIRERCARLGGTVDGIRAAVLADLSTFRARSA
jgi:hypothetical protein